MLSGSALPECRQSEPRNYRVREGFTVRTPGDRQGDMLIRRRLGNAAAFGSTGAYPTVCHTRLNRNLAIATEGHQRPAVDPTGLLVATPVEGNPNLLSIREYKGY